MGRKAKSQVEAENKVETVEEETPEEETPEVVEEEETPEETPSTPAFEDASAEVTKYGVYRGDTCIAVFTKVNHGDDFIKIAKAKAKALNAVARPFVNPLEPEVEKTVVNLVNASNNLVRQFSLSVHGKDYVKLAEAYVEKYGAKQGIHIQTK